MDKRVVELLRVKQYEQRTPEWFDIRETMVTASSAACLLIKDDKTCDSYIKEYNLEDIFDKNKKCCNPYNSKTQFILDKCKQGKFKGNVATFHGQKYEPVVTDIYSVLLKKQVLEFGLIQHKEYDWLGASPDGITTDGIMIEIKCPFRRKISGIPPFYYWIQVQLQLEVCNLEYCDFVEYEFTEFSTEEEFLDDKTLDINIHNKGLFIKVEKQEDPNILCNPEDIQYIYPEKEFIDNIDDLIKWRDIQLKNLPLMVDEQYKDVNFIYTTIYWKVTEQSIVRIKRDREWFQGIKNVLEKEWERVLYYKKNDNYKKLIKEKKKYTDGTVLDMGKECIFSDDEK